MKVSPVLALPLATVLAAAIALPAVAASQHATVRTASDEDPRLSAFYEQEISWGACEGRGSSVECATIFVPLDYEQPQGRTIELALLRVRSSSDAAASLVVNPGGPGAGGLDFAEYIATVIEPDVRAAYDIVGFDPRGVGESAPIECLTGRQTTRWYRTDTTPDTAAERRTLTTRAAGISRGCLTRDPELARSVGTDASVRDMDVIRSALGDSNLNWLGFSYGTVLGARYAERFPDRVGRMVLDGAVDPGLDAMEVSKDQSDGFQRAMRRFAADCAKRSDCIAATPQQVLTEINSILNRLDRTSMRTDGTRRLVQSEALTAMFFSMYSTDLWPTLRTGLRQAANGDGTTLQLLAQLANDQIGPNKYGSNIASAFYAIGCWDYPATPAAAGLRSAARQWAEGAAVPEMGRAMSWGNAPCSTWFGHSPYAPAPVDSQTRAPILIIGTTFDPATPYIWSQALNAQLPTSRLLTYRGDGHTAYGSTSVCIDDLTDTYLLTGALPEPGTTCSK